MILGGDFGHATFGFIVEREIFNQVDESRFAARPSDQRFQRDDAAFTFAVDPFPVREVLPARRHGADLGLPTIGKDDQRVVPKHLRNRVLVILQVVLVSVLDFSVTLFQLDEDKRQAVHEADQVRPTFVDARGR